VIRTVIVDDEPLARVGLRMLLKAEPDIEIVGEAEDSTAAVALITETQPQLVMLDVQMPAGDGFDVLRRVGEIHLPVVVFVSAHDRFALRAFEVHALDYLLKPVVPERLAESLRRVRIELASEDRAGARALARLLDGDDPLERRERSRRFAVRERDRFVLVPCERIERIEAAGNYVQLYTGGRTHLLRSTMADVLHQLDPASFVRIHRSWIVNVEGVASVVPSGNGDFEVHLHDGTVLPMSRNYRHTLLPRAGSL